MDIVCYIQGLVDISVQTTKYNKINVKKNVHATAALLEGVRPQKLGS